MIDKDAPTSKTQTALRLLIGALMLMAGMGHLTFQREEFQAQVPQWLPLNADFVVIASGVVEIVFGVGMLVLSRYKVWLGLALALFYVLIFPGNISQYTNEVDAFGLDTDRARLIRLFF